MLWLRAELLFTYRDVTRRGPGGSALNRGLSGFFTKKNWLCWDVGPALFSKVTLFSLQEVFCGPQICQNALAAEALPLLMTFPQTP